MLTYLHFPECYKEECCDVLRPLNFPVQFSDHYHKNSSHHANGGRKPEPEPINNEAESGQVPIQDDHQEPSEIKKEPSGKFPKKLLRQRSFSADYQPEGVRLTPEPPRRFSASPNIGTHRYNSNTHTPHNQQISIDSEESFVTIIPNHNHRGDGSSPVDTPNAMDNMTDFEFEADSPLSSPDYTCSYSSDDDAYCENIDNDESNTSNDNASSSSSSSSALEATVRSAKRGNGSKMAMKQRPSSLSLAATNEDGSPSAIIQDDDDDHPSPPPSSPPNNLHRYFHLFRRGEVERMIEEHVQNLHIIDSFYNECAMSWCIVAEKIHVWTI